MAIPIAGPELEEVDIIDEDELEVDIGAEELEVDIGAVVELILLEDEEEVLGTMDAVEVLWGDAEDEVVLLVDFEPRAT